MRLLHLDNPGIEKVVSEYDNNTKALKEELLRICWYMRGGVGFNESHLMTPDERAIVTKIIEQNLATTKESGMPFF
jgi:hypothetical protein